MALINGRGTAASRAVLSWGANSVAATTVVRYLFPWYHDALAPSVPFQLVMPMARVARSLYVHHGVTAGNGGVIVYALRVAGVTTALTAALTSTGTDASDLVHAVMIPGGSLVDLVVTKAVSVGTSPGNVVVTIGLFES